MAAVLLIDHDATHREPTGKLLRTAGYEVLRAANGSDALELLDQCQVDLILLDIRGPGIDGVEFLRTLRKDDDRKSLPVVVMSQEMEANTIDALRSLDANDHLVKFRHSSKELLDVVGERLTPAYVA